MNDASLEIKQGETSSADVRGLQASHRACAGAHPEARTEQVILTLLLSAGQTHKYCLSFILLVGSFYVCLWKWIWMKITAGLRLVSRVGSSGAGLFGK